MSEEQSTLTSRQFAGATLEVLSYFPVNACSDDEVLINL